MAKYSIVELAVSNGNLVGVDQLSNNQKRALELNNAIYIYRGTRSKKVYIGQTMHFIERHKQHYNGTEEKFSTADFNKVIVIFSVYFNRSAMDDVESGKADYAVIPIENSSAGAVVDNYDLLIKHHIVIVAETCVAVDHALLGLPKAELTDVERVYSHPQALMQCSQYLNARKDWQQISVENTAVAAKKIIEDQDIHQAAVASRTAGKLYGLKVLAASINHNRNNTTRFLILAKEQVYRKEAEKISICFELPHKSGSLYNMLGNFIYNGVNMRMIESRPILGRNWEYRFFVDIEGNLSDPSIQNALKSVSEEAANMRILGNY